MYLPQVTIVTTLLCLLSLAHASSSSSSKTVLCYYESWAQWHTGDGRFTAAQMPHHLCTNIVYTFIVPQAGGQIQPFDDAATLSALVALRTERNPALRVSVAIGGWNAGSTVFSEICADEGERAQFVQACVEFVQQHQLDGIDIDWEYPAANGGAAEDVQNYVAFLRELRSALGSGKLITAAVAAGVSFIGSTYDVRAIAEQLDFINLMAYDYHASWDGRTGQNAPLYASQADTDRTLNADASVRAWIRAGAEPKKILLGLGFYGHTFQLAGAGRTGVGAPTVGAGAAGPFTQQQGTASYLEICQWLKEEQEEGAWTTVYDEQQQSVYSFNAYTLQWIGYDNVRSIEAKTRYALAKGLGGVMMWAVDDDDVHGVCGGGAMPLLTAVNKVMRG